MDEERKDNIKFSIFTTVGLLFLPIAAPIMWVSEKIYFRERVKFIDVIEASLMYIFLCLSWGGCVLFLWKMIEGCMNAPFTVLWVASIIFVFVGIPYLFCLGINGIIDYKNKKSEKYFDKF